MKVAFIARTDLYRISGGDTVQIEGTAQALRQLGVTVDIHLSDEIINYNDYDLLHFFNIIDCEDILGPMWFLPFMLIIGNMTATIEVE